MAQSLLQRLQALADGKPSAHCATARTFFNALAPKINAEKQEVPRNSMACLSSMLSTLKDQPSEVIEVLLKAAEILQGKVD